MTEFALLNKKEFYSLMRLTIGKIDTIICIPVVVHDDTIVRFL